MGVPNGIWFVPQIQSAAGFVTRMHPCDAGYDGTLGDPCTAWPADVKYFGR